MKHKILKGFTMVELLVAMAIIGLLIATAIWGIGIAQQGARNTQRREAGAQLLAGTTEYFARFNQQPNCIFPFSATEIRFGTNGSTCTAAPTTQFYAVPLAGNAVTPNLTTQRLSVDITGNGTDAQQTEYVLRTSATNPAAPAGVNILVCVCMEGGGFADLSEPQGTASRTACGTVCP
jgi:prepilin-type N-terminal cleavage/methylation domain-containing protein